LNWGAGDAWRWAAAFYERIKSSLAELVIEFAPFAESRDLRVNISNPEDRRILMTQEAKPKHYVCPKCNVTVDEPIYPTEKKNGPKCANGHSIYLVYPFGLSLAVSLGITLIFIPLYYGLIQILPVNSRAFSVAMAVLRLGIPLLLVVSIWVIVSGSIYSQKAEPTKRLAAGTIGQGIGMLFGTMGGALIIYFILRSYFA
jgi:hypothetical protein